MAVRVAINGFGRIGRLVFRALFERNAEALSVVAINDLGPVETNAHLLRHDSIHGKFPGTVTTGTDTLDLGRGTIKVLAERDPEKLPWKDLDVAIVLECTGRFTKRADAERHLKAGAKRVLISAPADGADLTVVYGVNHDKLAGNHVVISNASCTTNCLAPVAHVLHKEIGIARGYMTTVHAYTGDQQLVDTLHKDLRRARAAAQSMIPTSTGAARALGLVLPDLKGKLDGCAIRVPVANVSLIDLVFTASRETTIDEINKALTKASQGPLSGILAVSSEPLVSTDYNHTNVSATVDLAETQVVDKTLGRVLAWYDNEWGFSNRMVDTAVAMANLG
ncbi:MAG: type I glyceraldehyde-3-phosphate dehydrogenase [Alphaproteobacteria bacterium]